MRFFALAVLAILTVGPFALAGPATEHKVSNEPTRYGAVTLSSFDKRIEESARDYQREYPPNAIARFVLFDSALPLDLPEYNATGKNGVLLLSAFSHDADDLPLANAYMGGVKLKSLGSKHRENPVGSLARAEFGPYRVDCFYLVPVDQLRRDPTVSVDFAKNRLGFLVGQSTWEEPDFVVRDRSPQSDPNPSIAALKILIDREYPGFGIEPTL